MKKKKNGNVVSLLKQNRKKLLIALVIVVVLLIWLVAVLAEPDKKTTTSSVPIPSTSSDSSTSKQSSSSSTPATNTPTTSTAPTKNNSSAGGTTTKKATPSNSSSSTPTPTPSPSPAPAAPVFAPQVVTQKIFEEITVCSFERYIFNASASANMAGTVNWQWVRWDGGSSGVSGTMTFNSDGMTSDGITAYNFWIHPNYDVNGWVALKMTWPNGSYTSPHADFTYIASQVDLMGC